MTVYLILIRRPIDKHTWPHVYVHKDLAEKAIGRVSPVIEVEVEETVTDRWCGMGLINSKTGQVFA